MNHHFGSAGVRAASMLCLSLLLLPAGARVAAQDPPTLIPQATQPAKDATGPWSGTINVPAQPLAFAIELKRDGETWTGTLDIPAQGAKAMPLAELSVADNQLRFKLANVPGDPTFEGTIAGDTITGTLTQGGGTIPFELKRGELTKPKRPQEPVPPFPYEARDVTFESLSENVTLAGTITLPRGEGPFPAVVLVSGSGSQNRDEEVFGHKPFLVLSDRLTRAGIAVLRYDDRGAGQSTGDAATATSLDLSQDAEAAVNFLRQQPKIRADAVGIVGHSEGGIIAPMVAARSKDVAFIVLMAGPGVSGDQILVRQIREGALAEGVAAEAAEAGSAAIEKLVELIRADADESAIRAGLEQVLRVQASIPADQPVPLGAVDAMYKQFAGPWFRYFFSYDPAATLAKVNVPVLVLQGELDRQVNAEVNVAAIRKALGHNPNVRVEVLEGLNHLFQPATTGGGSEYANIEITMDEQVPKLIAEWVKQQTQ